MKTLNFLEALEANKTRRVKIKCSEDSYDWFPVNRLRKNIEECRTPHIHQIEGQWEAEPEKYEFEPCSFFETSTGVIALTGSVHDYRPHIGKKCKLTIELLD
jgi:hypothetical protein